MYNNEKIVLQFEDYTITAFESDDKTYYNGYFKNANNETVDDMTGMTARSQDCIK